MKMTSRFKLRLRYLFELLLTLALIVATLWLAAWEAKKGIQ